MVKIPLSVEQINALLKWRDEHKELVRALIIPFPECSITSESNMKVRVKQDKASESVYHFTVSNTKVHYVAGRFAYETKSEKVYDGLPTPDKETIQSAITVWASVMAYIVNFEPEIIEKEYDETKNKERKRRSALQQKQKRPENSVLYLNPIKYITDGKNATQRKYTPPSCAFSVRGHYRHLKSGKIVIEGAKIESKYVFGIDFADTIKEAELSYKNSVLECIIMDIRDGFDRIGIGSVFKYEFTDIQ